MHGRTSRVTTVGCRQHTTTTYGTLASWLLCGTLGLAGYYATPTWADQPAPATPATAPASVIQVKVKSVKIEGLSGAGALTNQVLAKTVELNESNGVYSAAAPGQGGLAIPLGQLGGDTGRVLDASALNAVVTAASKAILENGQAATVVNITQSSLDSLRADSSDGVLVLNVIEAKINQVRAVVTRDGQVVSQDEAAYLALRDNSPVNTGDVVKVREIDRYIHRLNRNPMRQVDVALSPGGNPGQVNLDYMIAETKPWLVYFQASNTGTPETSEWRERIGLSHFDLTQADDILTLDYVTGDFDKVHAFNGSYERPFPGLPELRGKIFGSWSQYDASDVGFAQATFTGESFGIGGELAYNFFQYNALFLDAVAGINFRSVKVVNELAMQTGDTDFLLPYFGIRGDHRTVTSNTAGSLILEFNTDAVTDGTEVLKMGRTNADKDWLTLRYEFSHSFFLEPWLVSDWGTDPSNTQLAHEIFISSRGQWTPGKRVNPNFVQPVGGFYSVRGYPESFAVGDSAFVNTLEYRFHLPRIFTPAEPVSVFGQPFRVAPQQAGGRPDWDLIFRGFLDVGTTIQNEKLSFERDVTPVGMGVGMELQLMRNVNVRVDWGFALSTENTGTDKVTSGASRVHLLFTVMY